MPRFRGIESLDWWPGPTMNLVLGGGNIGKKTIVYSGFRAVS